MALQDAGKTDRFWVQYEDTADPPSHQLANAVLATCEKDLLLLNSYLPTDRGAHDLFKTHPVVIQITPTAPQPGGASNTGFKVGIQSYIKIHPFSPSGPASDPLPGSCQRSPSGALRCWSLSPRQESRRTTAQRVAVRRTRSPCSWQCLLCGSHCEIRCRILRILAPRERSQR